MSVAKQAKILSKAKQKAVLSFLGSTRYPVRDHLICLFSVMAGLRAKEIAALKWEMVMHAEGEMADVIALTNEASEGRRGGQAIPIAKDLKAALKAWKAEVEGDYRKSPYAVASERELSTSSYAIVNKFAGWYRALGVTGASSHSGRRTAIANWARRISTVGGSLRDVLILAGHSALITTQRYTEADGEAMRRVVDFT